MFKYPKTMHLPWSPGLQNDDRLITSLEVLMESEVVVTEKMDGENATLYSDHYHARSLDSRHHPSRDWIKSFHGQIKYLLPTYIRICGENLYAEHSIRYEELTSYFQGFSVWDNDPNVCWNWDETIKLFQEIGITPVREIWRGPGVEFYAHHEQIDVLCSQPGIEGYVVRTVQAFPFADFSTHVAKFVRKDHVQTDQHWMQKPVVPNGIRKV